MNSRSAIPFVSVVFAALAGCGPEEEPRRIVAKGGCEVPSAFDPIPIMGRTFYALQGSHQMPLLKAHPELAMFDNPWMEMGFKLYQNDILGLDKWMTTNLAYRGSYPVKFSEVFENCVGKNQKAAFEKFNKEHPANPYTLVAHGGRPLKWLKEKFDTDREDFAEWRRTHTNFFAFCAFDEYDSDAISLTWQKGSIKDEKMRKRLVDEYDLDHLDYGFPRKWARHDFEKAKSFYFGSDELYGLWSVEPSLAHILAGFGLKFLWYEAEHGSVAAPWAWGAVYARGAARQFRIPFGWYTAMFTYNTVTRDGQKPENVNTNVVMWRDSFTYWPNPGARKKIPHLGSSRSLLRRNYTYGYLIGNLLSVIECGAYSMYACAGKDGSEWTMSPYGEDYNRLHEWHRHHERGTVYTPVALLCSMDEGVHRQGFNSWPAKDEATIMSFLHTLVPSRTTNPAIYCEPRQGFEGCLWNSEFGEIADVIAPDCGQKTGDILAALRCYKAAFLLGYLDPKLCDTAAIAQYIAEGGTVICSYDQVVDGLIGAGQAGVRFGEKGVPAGKALVDERGERVEEIKEPYTLQLGEATTAKPFFKDENGNVVAYIAEAGRGRVVTVTVRRMMPDAFKKLKETGWKSREWFNGGLYKSVTTGERTFPIIHALLKIVQDDVMPVKVAGDIQWGLNKVRRKKEEGRSEDRWLLWLINNNGIIKYALDPEEFDMSKTSVVTVDLHSLRGAKVFDITDPDPAKSVELVVEVGKFTVSVKPGEDRRISIVR